MKRRSARVLRGTPRQLEFLARHLRAGEIVAVPTETVYGLAGNALDPAACAKIFRAKGRPSDDPLIVHLHSVADLPTVCAPNAAALKLAAAFWPGPLTLVLPKTPAVPDIVTAGRESVAVRMPRHPLFRRLLKLAGVPLAAPSANPFGYISPTTAEHVRANLGAKISYILDGGPAAIGVESTIVDLRDPARPKILRPGAITAKDLARVLGRPVANPMATPTPAAASSDAATLTKSASAIPKTISARRANPALHAKAVGGRGADSGRTGIAIEATTATRGQLAPGLLARHYSPRTPVVLHEHIDPQHVATAPRDEAWVFLRPPALPRSRRVLWLDRRGELRGVAQRLFAVLRALDVQGFARIHVELAPAEGLGLAINDRLRRAAAR